MNITTVIDDLNRRQGLSLSAEYYAQIEEWMCWWRGFYKPFHTFVETAANGKRMERKLYTMRMGKKVCEDWASILLNDKTTIGVGDAASSAFLQGTEEESGLGGVLGRNAFWLRGNELVEKAFASGTGAVVLRMRNMALNKKGYVLPHAEATIEMEFLPASGIIPITVRAGRVVDAAFVSEVLSEGETRIYIETHTLEKDGYTIRNRCCTEKHGVLEDAPLPEGVAGEWHTGSDVPLFSLVKPNIVNNVDESTALGISVFANAIDNLTGVDLAYNNFCRDLKLGGKKVFVNSELTRRDESGYVITPDDVAQQLFTTIGDRDLGDGRDLIQEFNPALRVQENMDGVQAQLDYLSFKVGFGTKHYQFASGGNIVTATQYTGDRQELVQNAAKHYVAVEEFLRGIVRGILWAGKAVCGAEVDPQTNVAVNFEDSYIIDKEEERERDRKDVRDGFLQKWEYRAKWYGEDEETARKAVMDGAVMGTTQEE